MAVDKICIDFDSVNTNIYMLGGGLVLSEPTVAAVGTGEKAEVKAIGEEAIEEYYCHPNQRYARPNDFCSYGERKNK